MSTNISSSSRTSICVYCGSSAGKGAAFKRDAYDFGKRLAQSGLRLIYGGGNVGTMGALAEGALDYKGEVIGVIPEVLLKLEVAHKSLTKLIVVDSMQTRKAKMAELADAFVALPGGIGTFEEIFEVITMTQLGIHDKPCAFLNTHNFYDTLLNFLQQTVDAGFIRQAHLDSLLVADNAPALLTQIQAYRHQVISKQINR